MNTFNRVVMVILLLVVMMLCMVMLIAPVRLLTAIAQQLTNLADILRTQNEYLLLGLGIFFAVLTFLVFALFIFLEVRRPALKAIRVEKTAGGDVLISVASITDRLRYEIDQLPSVLRTRSSVSSKRGGVVVELDVETAAGINVPAQAGQIVEAAQRVIEEGMGLKLARAPKVNLRAMPYPKAPKSVAVPHETIAPKPQSTPPAEPVELPPAEPVSLPEDTGEDA